MNAGIYKLIFSKRLNALVVVGEICSSQGKAPGTTRALKRSARGMFQIVKILGMFSSGALLVSSAWAAPAPNALPTGGQVVQGAASISQSNAQMDINQASQRAVINWQTFDVGADAKVHIIQPNQAAVLLNRVVTNKPSEIYGKIDANGQVILVNNNGIIFGKDGSASASSFTATTLDINDQDFMDGKDRYSSNGTQGEIVNHGTIEAKNGGYVALLGAKVTNDGKIITHNGTVALGAADSIAIPMTSSGKIKMQLSAGSINAAVENTKNAVIVTEGGDVYLQAAAVNSAMASIKHSGQIDTSGEQAGKAVLLADNGEITVDGSITANSTNQANKGGDIIIGRDIETGVLAKTTDVSGASLESKKGFVETSAHHLKVDGIKVKAKEWLLDPDDIEITDGALTAGYTSQVSTATITNALNNGTNISLDTATGSTGVNGNILVTSAINATNTTNTDATLTLKANNGIKVNNSITGSTASGSLGKINVTMTALGTAGDADSGVKFTGNGNVDITGNLQVTGTNTGTTAGISIMPGATPLTLKAAGNITLIGKNTKAAVAGAAGGADQAGIQIDAGSDANAAAYGAVTNITSGGALTLDGSTVAGLRAIAMGGTGGIFTAAQKLVGDGYTINLNSVGDLIVNAKNENKSAAVAGSSTAAIHTNIFSVLNATSSTGAIMLLGDKATLGGNVANSGGAVNLSGNVTFNSANGTTIAGKTDQSYGGQGVLISRGSKTNATAQTIDVMKGDLTIYGAGSNGVGIGYYKAPTWSTTPAETAAAELVGTKITANSVAGQNVTISGLGSSGYGVQAYGTALSNTANATGTLIDAKGDVNINGYVQSTSGNIALNLNSGAINGANVYIAGSTSSSTANAVTFGSGTRNVLNQGTTYAYQTNNKVAVTATNQLKIQGAEKSVAATLINSGLFSIDTAIVTPATMPSPVSFATSVGGVGIGLDAGSSWTAANIQAAGKTGSYNGVLFGAGSSVTTTSNSGDSKISAIASATSGAGGAGAFQIGSGVNLKAATGSTLTLDGQATGVAATGSSFVRGMRIDGGIGVDGNVAIKGTSNSSDGLLVINGVIAAKANSLLTLYGKTSGNGGFGSGVYTVNSGGVTLGNGASVSITGKAENQATPAGAEYGVNLSGAGITQATGATTAGNISITGSTTSANNASAVTIAPTSITTSNSGNIVINGTATQATATAIQIASTATLQAANVTFNGTSTAGAGVNGTGKVTATSGNVLIEGISGNTGGYATITNGPINASGDITIKGIGTAKHGVSLGNNVAGNDITSTGGKVTVVGDTTYVGGVAGSGTGSAVTGYAVINADKDVNITGKTFGYYSINGLGNITSKSGGVTIDGYSRDSRAVSYDKTITATNGDIKVIGVSGNASLVGSGNEHGVYFSGLAKGKNVTIDGTSINSVGTFIGSAGTNIDASDSVTVLGKSTSSIGVNLGSANGTAAFRATIKSGGDTTVNGTGLMNGVKIWETSSITANNINITGNAVTTNAAQVGNGVDFQRYSAVATLTATNDINIEGTVSGLGSGSGIKTSWSGQNGNGPVMKATNGNFTLRGNNRAATGNMQAAIYAESGMQVTAGNNIVVQAETNNDQTNAMNFYSLGDMYRGNASFVSTGGDVLIQANQGSIYFNNQQPSAVGQLTDIKGRNITIDNTGAGMAIGAGTAFTGTGGTKGASIGTGTGYARVGVGGVVIADGRKLTASQNISITGATKDVNVNSEPGVKPGLYSAIYNTGTIEATSGTATLIAKAEGSTQSGTAIYNTATGIIKGGSVVLDGTSTLRLGVSSFGAITSTIADVNIKGSTSAANNTAIYGVLLNAPIQSKANLSIVGTGNNTHGVYLQGTIDADGSIIVDGTTGTAATATSGHGVVNFATITAKGKDANGHAIDITGKVIGGSLRPAVNFQAGSAINNKSSGGSTNISATQGVVYLTGTSKITNDSSAGAINITAGDGTSASTAYILSSSGATITQNSDAGINMTTDGQGNLTVAKIINNGKGDVNIGAGKLLAAGYSGGGQVKTVAGNSITMNPDGGQLLVYSGSLTGTGKLSNLNAGYNNLFYAGTSNALNTAFNQAYGDQINAGQGSSPSNTQILFREALGPTGTDNQPSFTLTLADLSKTYGDADPATQAALNAAFQAAYTASHTANSANSPVLLTSTVRENTFALNASDVISSLTGMTRALGEDVKYDINGNVVGYAYDGVAAADSFRTSVTQSKMIINRRDITLGDIIASDKQYDGNNLASITGATLGNTFNNETLGLTGTAIGTFDGVNAQNGRTVTVSDLSLLQKVDGVGDSGGKWSNYNLTLTGSKTTTANITKRDVTLSSITADNKTYDGNDVAVISSGSIATGVDGETLNISGTGQFASKDAGDRDVTVSLVENLDKVDGSGVWSNYNLTTTGQMTTAVKANIAKKNVTLDSITADNKTYDGNRDAVISSGSIDTGVVVNGNKETLKISGTGNFDTKHFGTDKTVTVADVALLNKADGENGGEWKNYNLTSSGDMTAKANINKADLTVAASQVTKTYDGTVNVDSTYQANIGALAAGETIASGVIQQFTNKDHGSNKTVRASGLTIKDADNNNVTTNYNINYVDNNVSVIDQANLTVTASQVIKTYDGTLLVNSIDQALVGDLAGQAAGESVSNAATQQFTDKNAGSNKTVRASGLTIKDADSNDVTANYKIDYVDNTNSTIDKRSLVAELVGKVSKVYDGTTSIDNLTTDHVKVSNWAEGEGASVAGMTGYYVNKNVDANQGNGKVKANLGELSAKAGTNLDNYELPTKDLTANIGEITARALTVKVNDSMVIATQTANQASDQGFSYLGNQDGETAADIFGNNAPTAGDRVITGVDANQSLAVGSYTNAFGLNKNLTALHGNYNVTVQNGDLKVVPVDKLLITIASQSDEYGNRNAANAGLADTVSAQYVLDKSKAATGSNLVNLTMSRLADGRWQGTDSTNTNVVFSTLVNGAGFSTGGYLNAGNYQYDATPTTPKNNTNFNDSTVNGGVLTVTPRFIKTQIPVVKTYDGSDSLLGVDLVAQNAMSGDKIALGGAGHYSQKNVGTNLDYSFNGIHAVGADKANYAVTVENQSISGRDGIIKPRLLTVEGSSAASKVYDGTTAAVVTNGKLTGLVAGESLLLSSDGKFRSSALGAKIPVDVRYKLENGVKDLASNYTLDPNAVLYADIVEEAKQLLPAEVLVNPVPVNPTYVTPNTKIVINELVTTLHKDEQIQKQCSLEFSKECKAEPVTITDNAPRYVTFY